VKVGEIPTDPVGGVGTSRQFPPPDSI
jgi:hypothetical protein